MAKTIENDILLSESLVSPGFRVDFAVGTTYSIDLEYLLGITVFLGLLGEMDDLLRKSPHYLLNAVLESRDKFIVFCNASNISTESVQKAKSATKLYTLMENSIKPLCLSTKTKEIRSFHPKVWVIKESSVIDNSSQIKVIVMSRNMAQSSCLDIAAVMTGKIEDEPTTDDKNKPLCDFLEWLNKDKFGCDKTQRKKIDGLIDDLKKVKTFELNLDSTAGCSELFSDYQFLPIGIDGYNGKDCLDEMTKATDCVIMSPFIDKSTLIGKSIKDRFFVYKGNKTLITRKEWLNNEIFERFNESGGIYVSKEQLLDSEDFSSDIHAKMYFTTFGGENRLYLGSANATSNGFGRNVEFLLRLTYQGRKTSYNAFREELIFDKDECLFERLDTFNEEEIKEEKTDDKDFRRAVIALQETKAEAVEVGDVYSIILHTKKIPDGVRIYPIHRKDLVTDLSTETIFEGMKLSELSELFIVEANEIARVVKIPVKNICLSDRDNAIKNSIIDTPAKFLDYLGYMLSDTPDSYPAEMCSIEKNLQNYRQDLSSSYATSPLYEEMLRLCYSDPKRILMIREKIEGIDKNIFPKGFKDFYLAFEKAAKTLKRHE